MSRTDWMRPAAFVLTFALGTIGCGGSEDSDLGSGSSQAGEFTTPRNGEAAEVLLERDSTLGGYAVMVLRRDGSRVPALFRGPAKLAEQASGGDFEFHEDSLPSRVRLLAPGEELRKPGGQLP